MASPCDAYLHAVKFAAMMIEALSEKAGCACVCQPESASLLCQCYVCSVLLQVRRALSRISKAMESSCIADISGK